MPYCLVVLEINVEFYSQSSVVSLANSALFQLI